MNQNKTIVLIILILSVLGSLYFGVQFWENVWLLFGISGLLSFFYVWKIPGLNGKNLRDVPGIKIYIIAIVWVIICVLVPYLINPNLERTELIFIILSELLFMISITIPFDIRDINLDEDSKKTIPQLIGVKKSVWISILLLISSQILLFFVLNTFNFGLILTGLIGSVVLFFAKPNRQELYFSGIIDGLLIAQPIILFVMIN